MFPVLDIRFDQDAVPSDSRFDAGISPGSDSVLSRTNHIGDLMKDHSADHSHSPESGEIVRRVLAALDPKSRHHLLNEFHAIQTGLYLVDAAHRAGDDETFTRAMKQLNHAIDRLTYATEVGGDVSVEDGSDAT